MYYTDILVFENTDAFNYMSYIFAKQFKNRVINRILSIILSYVVPLIFLQYRITSE